MLYISFISKRRFCNDCGKIVYDECLDNKTSEIAIEIFNNKYDKEFLNFYRGHSSSKYRLEPSLFRKKDDGSYHYLENENTIYNELLTQNYSEFDTDSGLVA